MQDTSKRKEEDYPCDYQDEAGTQEEHEKMETVSVASWDEVGTRASVRSYLVLSTAKSSSFDNLTEAAVQEDVPTDIPRPIPAASEQALLEGEPTWELASMCEVTNHMGHNNKFTLTTGSFKLPWSLEAVIRPESPKFAWPDFAERYFDYCLPTRGGGGGSAERWRVKESSCLASMAIFEDDDDLEGEEDYAEDQSGSGNPSLISSTVRIPISLASDMLMLLFKLVRRPKDSPAVVEPQDGISISAE